MKLEDLAQNAARQARNAAQEMPIVPIKDARRQRRAVGALIPILGVAATWIVIAVLTPPPTQAPSVATNPTSTSVRNTQTSTAVPTMSQTVVVTDSDLTGFEDRTDTNLPLQVEPANPESYCCIAQGIDDEVLVLSSNFVLSIGADEVITWNDMDGRAVLATPEGLVIAGTDDSGSSILRLYANDGSMRWSMPLGVDWGETPQLALDANNVIWRGVRNSSPEGSGFADVQWFPTATLDGTQDESGRRTEFRPFPDGRSVGISDHTVSLAAPNGNGTRWELPAGLTVLSADPFLDGVLATATADPSGDGAKLFVLFLRSSDPIAGLTFDRYWGTVVPGPTTIVANGQSLFGLGLNSDGPILSVLSLDTFYPLPRLSLDGVPWIGTDHQTIRSADGAVLSRGRYTLPGRPSAWDEDGGVVTFGDEGLLWLTADGESSQPLPDEAIAEIVEVVLVDDGHVVGARLLDSYNTIVWFRLETGALTEPPAGARTLDGVTFSAAGRTATIALPDWSKVQRGEGGEPIPPYELPELVITGANDTELLRVTVGTTDRPYVQIHDFDGRRLILSASPGEPASPPQTVWIIDLECSECTEVVSNGHPVWFDLIGTLKSTAAGELEEPRLPIEPTRQWP